MYYYYITKEPRFLLIPGENVDICICLVPRPIAVVPILHKTNLLLLICIYIYLGTVICTRVEYQVTPTPLLHFFNCPSKHSQWSKRSLGIPRLQQPQQGLRFFHKKNLPIQWNGVL